MAGPWDPAALTQQYPQYQEQQYQYQEQQQYNLGWAPMTCGWAVTYFQQGPPPPAFAPPAFIPTPLTDAAPPPYDPPGFGPHLEQHRSQAGARVPHPEQHRSRAGARVFSGSRAGRREPAPGKLLARFRQGLPPLSGADWTLQVRRRLNGSWRHLFAQSCEP